MRFVGEKRAIRIFFLTVFLLSHCISYIDASCLESSFCYVAQIYSSITTGFNYTICLLYAFNHSNGKSLSLWLVFLCLIIPCCCCFFLWNSNRSLYIVPSINAFFLLNHLVFCLFVYFFASIIYYSHNTDEET